GDQADPAAVRGRPVLEGGGIEKGHLSQAVLLAQAGLHPVEEAGERPAEGGPEGLKVERHRVSWSGSSPEAETSSPWKTENVPETLRAMLGSLWEGRPR